MIRVPSAPVLLVIASMAGCTAPDDPVPSRREAVGSARQAYTATGPVPENGLQAYVITSTYQAQPAKLWVRLPAAFDPTHHYEVLYVLPAWELSRDGMDEAINLGLADKYDIILVGPDFCTTPWYNDSDMNPQLRYDSYLPDVVVPFIDSKYPTVAAPHGRMLIGYSKAGYGSVSLLLHHPDVFGRAGTWDGDISTMNRPEFECSDAYFNANYWIPTVLNNQAAHFAGQPARFAVDGYDFFQQVGLDFHNELSQHGVLDHYDNSIMRDHAWNSGWFDPLTKVLVEEMADAPLGGGGAGGASTAASSTAASSGASSAASTGAGGTSATASSGGATTTTGSGVGGASATASSGVGGASATASSGVGGAPATASSGAGGSTTGGHGGEQGSSDAGADGGTGGPGAKGGCGCRAAGGEGEPGAALAMGALALVGLRRRRRGAARG